MVACYWLFVLFVKEPPLTEQQAVRVRREKETFGAQMRRHVHGIGTALGYALSDRYFLVLFFSVFTYQAGVLAGIGMYTFLLDDWFGTSWDTPFATTYLVGPLSLFRDAFFLYIFFAIGCGVLFLPVWNWIGKRLEKRTCLMIGIVGIGMTYGASYLLFAAKSFPLLIVYALCQACFYCAAYIFPPSMLADIASNNELERGEANEGMFYGANSFLIKLYNAAAHIWTGIALKYLVRYHVGADTQAGDVIQRMRILYAAPALIAAVPAAAILFLYKLDRTRMAQVTAALDARKARARESQEG